MLKKLLLLLSLSVATFAQTTINGVPVTIQNIPPNAVTVSCVSASGNSTTYTCPTTVTSYTQLTNVLISWLPDMNGAGGPTTLNFISSTAGALGAKSVKAINGSTNPTNSDIVANQPKILVYNTTSSAFLMAATATGGGGGNTYDNGFQVYNVKYYGATGNGSTDDTSFITATMSAASSGSTVYFPCGTYLVTPPFTISSAIQWVGETSACATIKFNGTSSSNFINITASNVTLQNLTFDVTGQTGSGIGLNYSTTLSNFSLSGVTVKNASLYNVQMTTDSNVSVSTSTFIGAGNEQFLYNVTTGTNASNVNIRNSTFDATGASAAVVTLLIENSGTGTLTNVNITNNRITYFGRGVTETDGVAVIGGHVTNTAIIGNTIVATATTSTSSGIEINGQNIIVSNNVVFGSLNGINIVGSGNLNNVISGNIINCSLANCSGGTALLIANGTATSATGNVISGTWSFGIQLSQNQNEIVGNTINCSGACLLINVNASDLIINDNFLINDGTGTGIQFATSLSDVFIRNNHIKGALNGVNASGSSYTNWVISGTTFDGVSTNYIGNVTNAGLNIQDDFTGVQADYLALTDGATVTWTLGNNFVTKATLTFTVHSGSRTLNLSSPVKGKSYALTLVQDSTGGEGLILGTGCTWRVAGAGDGTVSLTNLPNAVDKLTFDYDGTYCNATMQIHLN